MGASLGPSGVSGLPGIKAEMGRGVTTSILTPRKTREAAPYWARRRGGTACPRLGRGRLGARLGCFVHESCFLGPAWSSGRHFPGRLPLAPLPCAAVQRSAAPACQPRGKEKAVGPCREGGPLWVGAPFSWMVNCSVCFRQRDQRSRLSPRNLHPCPASIQGSQASAPHLGTSALVAWTWFLPSSQPPDLISDGPQCGLPWKRTPDENPAVCQERCGWGEAEQGDGERTCRGLTLESRGLPHGRFDQASKLEVFHAHIPMTGRGNSLAEVDAELFGSYQTSCCRQQMVL